MTPDLKRHIRSGGFTLIEVLVAILILSILAWTGTRAVSNAVSSRDALQDRQAGFASLTRAVTLLRWDLGHVVIDRTEGAATVLYNAQENLLELRVDGLVDDFDTLATVPGRVVWQKSKTGDFVARRLQTVTGALISEERFDPLAALSLDVFNAGSWTAVRAVQTLDLSSAPGLRVTLSHPAFGDYPVAIAR